MIYFLVLCTCVLFQSFYSVSPEIPVVTTLRILDDHLSLYFELPHSLVKKTKESLTTVQVCCAILITITAMHVSAWECVLLLECNTTGECSVLCCMSSWL